jgi:predicted phage tail protein
MIRNIHLHGNLGKVAGHEVLKYDADNIPMLVAALRSFSPKLDYELRTSKLKVVGGYGTDTIEDFGEGFGFGKNTDIHVIPNTCGAWNIVISIVIEIIIAIVAAHLAAKIDTKNGPGQRTTIFSGPVNSTAQGGPIPIVYGKKVLVGSTIISTAIEYYNVALGNGPGEVSVPIITGSAVVGQVLTATSGTWNGAAVFTYQWYNSSSGAISDATSSSYTIQPSDNGHTLTIEVTATNANGATTQSSAPTGTVT